MIGTHSGSYSVYRALAVAAGALSREHRADLTNTSPTDVFGPYPQWSDPGQDRQPRPLGRHGRRRLRRRPGRGLSTSGPTIAVTKAHVIVPEVTDAMQKGRLRPRRPHPAAQRRGLGHQGGDRARLVPARRGAALRLQRGGPAPRAVRGDRRHVPRARHALRPRGVPAADRRADASTSSAIGRDLADPGVELTARVHDECNGSDVFGSDICTCRPYLTHAIEECIQGAQRGGVGVIAYSRKEGRALGEVTKFLVYNARKRQVGGDSADQYFARTECVAGVQDMRFQELMPDVLHWLGITKIHRLVSMSNMKYDAITGAGIEVGERVNIPDELIPADARVEIDAKMAAGYFTPGPVPDADELSKAKGRGLDRERRRRPRIATPAGPTARPPLAHHVRDPRTRASAAAPGASRRLALVHRRRRRAARRRPSEVADVTRAPLSRPATSRTTAAGGISRPAGWIARRLDARLSGWTHAHAPAR